MSMQLINSSGKILKKKTYLPLNMNELPDELANNIFFVIFYSFVEKNIFTSRHREWYFHVIVSDEMTFAFRC